MKAKPSVLFGTDETELLRKAKSAKRQLELVGSLDGIYVGVSYVGSFRGAPERLFQEWEDKLMIMWADGGWPKAMFAGQL